MKRELIAIIGRLKDPRLEGGLLTVTRLDVTPDLDVAKVYVSVMGRADGPKPAIEALNRAAGHVRTEVSKKMHIRKAPRFIFVEDDGAAYAAHINELLRDAERQRRREQPSRGDRGINQPAERMDHGMTEQLNVQQMAQRLMTADNILILCHKNPDGDTIGCGSALYYALKALDKNSGGALLRRHSGPLCVYQCAPVQGRVRAPNGGGRGRGQRAAVWRKQRRAAVSAAMWICASTTTRATAAMPTSPCWMAAPQRRQNCCMR